MAKRHRPERRPPEAMEKAKSRVRERVSPAECASRVSMHLIIAPMLGPFDNS